MAVPVLTPSVNGAGPFLPGAQITGTWTVTERFSFPVGKLGVFLHKVFTFEEEPDLRLFLGGFGELLLSGRTW